MHQRGIFSLKLHKTSSKSLFGKDTGISWFSDVDKRAQMNYYLSRSQKRYLERYGQELVHEHFDYNRTKEGASYILDDCSPKENLQQYWELHIKKIKRLEVIAKRSNNGNLSMMIEEITDIDSHGLLFGRCIHLDTDSKFGTDFENSILNHLDLAINIYEDEAAKKRLDDNLASGQVTTDASYRTHLLRVEKIPFKALFGFVVSFFKSQTLINEWLEDQFPKKDGE